MRNMRNLLLLTILVCSTNGLGRCACQCASNVRSKRSNSSSKCASLCQIGPPVGCTYTGVYGILDGVWDVISSETTGCKATCCFGGNVILEDVSNTIGAYVYIGNFTTLDHASCQGRQVADLIPWLTKFAAPLQSFAITFSGSPTSTGTYISYNEGSGKGTVSFPSGATQNLKCVSGPCLQNANLYTGGGTQTSASTKKVVTYIVVWMTILFIAPSR
jgi:hypothetical protein